MKSFTRVFFILALFASIVFLPGCPYRLQSLSPKYWDDSMKETTQDFDDVMGARSYN